MQVTIERAVPTTDPHTINRGDQMDQQKYDATYKFGNTIVNIVAPKNQTKEEIDQIIKEYHIAGRAIVKEMQEKRAAATVKTN
ncbi:hypothetical protein IHV12_15115 [Fictibacillus sp. 7GRE50]|uniref:hypothetical protein n=1 Tax=Fictibacillus sp. 7GRE50 TaxID=2745878 RepID=UPI0018CD1CC2|nr:hypothetical protein [Fictibacillus sp. 7GRE50]MBH0166252.1 hypothetical protein [Fictibacillus sp. 7GRE50]